VVHIFKHILTSIKYVLSNYTNCKDYQLVWWQKCSAYYDFLKDHVSETHFLFLCFPSDSV